MCKYYDGGQTCSFFSLFRFFISEIIELIPHKCWGGGGGQTENGRANLILDRSQWPRGLRRGSAAARLLGLRARIPRWA
jgi:hypothetical protein